MGNRVSGRIDLSDYLDEAELTRATHHLDVPGKVRFVESIPACDLCWEGDTAGPFDFVYRRGGWVHGCEEHYLLYRASEGLGVGKAQLWLERP